MLTKKAPTSLTVVRAKMGNLLPTFNILKNQYK